MANSDYITEIANYLNLVKTMIEENGKSGGKLGQQ